MLCSYTHLTVHTGTWPKGWQIDPHSGCHAKCLQAARAAWERQVDQSPSCRCPREGEGPAAGCAGSASCPSSNDTEPSLQADHTASSRQQWPPLSPCRELEGADPSSRDTDLWLRQGSWASWSQRGPVQPGWHSHTTLSFSTERHRPCLHTVQDLQPGETPSDCGGRALKSCSSLLMRTSWMQPWKPPSGRSAPWRKAERPVEVGIPVDGEPG